MTEGGELALSWTATTGPRGARVGDGGAELVLRRLARETRARRVLLIEDNIDALHSLAEYLGILGHEVAVAEDGESGIATAESFGPEVVIADIGLPKLDGFGVAQRLRRARNGDGPRIYLVAVTGYGGQEQRERALSAGFDLYLVKPVEPEALARLLSDL